MGRCLEPPAASGPSPSYLLRCAAHPSPGNACGTIGLLHALANNREKLSIGGCRRCRASSLLAGLRHGRAPGRRATAVLAAPQPPPPGATAATPARLQGTPPQAAPLLPSARNPAAAGGSFMHEFLAATEGMSPQERGAFLERPPEGAPDIDSIHQARLGLSARWHLHLRGANLGLWALPAATVCAAAACSMHALRARRRATPARWPPTHAGTCRRRRSRGPPRPRPLRRRLTCTLPRLCAARARCMSWTDGEAPRMRWAPCCGSWAPPCPWQQAPPPALPAVAVAGPRPGVPHRVLPGAPPTCRPAPTPAAAARRAPSTTGPAAPTGCWRRLRGW